MVLRPLYDPTLEGLPMKVACFMSGSGTNVTKIIEHQLSFSSKGKPCPYRVILIFTDVKDGRVDKAGYKICFAKDISSKFGIPYLCNDIRDFYHDRGHKTIRDLSLRREFDAVTLDRLKGYDVDLLALGGYMSILSEPLLNAFQDRIVNVHPADLSVVGDGKRKYVGMHGVRDAILGGEKYIYSSTFIVRQAASREEVDAGEILMRSEPVEVWRPERVAIEDLGKPQNKELLEKVVKQNQNRLKEKGDWVIFPKTLELIAEGRYAIDENGNIYVDGKLEKNGLIL